MCLHGLEAKSLNLDPNETAEYQIHHFLEVSSVGQQMCEQRVFSLQQQLLLPLDGRVVLKYTAYEELCLGAWVNFSILFS